MTGPKKDENKRDSVKRPHFTMKWVNTSYIYITYCM